MSIKLCKIGLAMTTSVNGLPHLGSGQVNLIASLLCCCKAADLLHCRIWAQPRQARKKNTKTTFLYITMAWLAVTIYERDRVDISAESCNSN